MAGVAWKAFGRSSATITGVHATVSFRPDARMSQPLATSALSSQVTTRGPPRRPDTAGLCRITPEPVPSLTITSVPKVTPSSEDSAM